MKLFADYEIENGYKRISIWNIYNGYVAYIANEKRIDFKEYYIKFFKNRIYSTHKVNKIPMTLVVKHPYGRSFFRYSGRTNGNGSLESISHSTYKDILNEMGTLNLVINSQQISLDVSYSDIEYFFKANGNDYYADVFIFFKKSFPEEYYYKWGGKLCIEINHTHAVEKRKIDDCYKQGIAVFEHSISKKLQMNENVQTEEELLHQKNFITKKLSEKIYGRLISNPSTEEYIMLQKLKSENETLKAENKSLQEHNAYLEEKLNTEGEEVKNLLLLKEGINQHRILRILVRLFKDLKNLI